MAVGGHLRAGETLATAIREAEEEIGLEIALSDLTRLGRRFTTGAGGADNEVQDVFAVRSDLPLDRYRLHPDEVATVVSIPLADALELFGGRRTEVAGDECARGEHTPHAVSVTVHDFAAGEVDGYAAHALRGLLDVVEGRSPEPFEWR